MRAPLRVVMGMVAIAWLAPASLTSAAPGGAPRSRPASGGVGVREGGEGVDGVDGVDAGEPADLELAGARVPVHGPSVGAVLAAAYSAAGLDRDPGGSWIRRARIAGLIPWVTVRTAYDSSWQDPQSDVGHSTALEVRATWRLDRLLFDSRELQVAALEASRRRERRRLAARVIRSYFTWRRAAGIADANDDRTSPRVAEAIAELDALTDGWFSRELARHRSSSATAPRAAP